MRYSLMLQFVVSSTIVLIGFAGFFAWLQNRPVGEESRLTFIPEPSQDKID